MAHGHVTTLQQEKLYLGSTWSTLGIPALVVGIVALAAAAGLSLGTQAATTHFFHSYLAAYAFFLALTLGCMFFVVIQYLARAGWSVTVRRLAEGMSMNIFLMAILIIPILLWGTHTLYEWMRPGIENSDEILKAKWGYLNPTFFYIRLVLYFVVWCTTVVSFASRSARQDKTGDPSTTTFLEKIGPVLTILSGFSLTGFAFDWVMSLNPHWFSTMFGVVFFANAMLSAFSAIVLLSLLLKKRGLLGSAITHEHYHDLGKWMFAFTFFWGYTAFAEYMLIWYANMPEETQFYLPRMIQPWAALSLVLLFVHFVIPFPGLLSRHIKRSNKVLAFWAVWSLAACAYHMWWLVVPSQWIKKIPEVVGQTDNNLTQALPKLVVGTHNVYQLNPAHASFLQEMSYPLTAHSVLITVLCFVGFSGLFVFTTMIALRGKPLVPTHDPRLGESLAFENI